MKGKKSSHTTSDSKTNDSLKSSKPSSSKDNINHESRLSNSKDNLNHENRFVRLKKVVRKLGPHSQQQIVLPSRDFMFIPKNSRSISKETEGSVNKDDFQECYPEAISEEDVMIMSSASHEDSQLINEEADLSSSSEIVLETIEELNSDCQYVIIVEDGIGENK